MSKLFYEQEFFTMQQPLDPFVKVQFKIPPKEEYATAKGFPVIDSYSPDTTEKSYLKIEKIKVKSSKPVDIYNSTLDEYEYWVDITTIIQGGIEKFTNNFVELLEIDDTGYAKKITLGLFDKYWSTLETIITMALQNPYYKEKGQSQNIPKEDISSNKLPLGLRQIFTNAAGLENVRVKFGYQHSRLIDDVKIEYEESNNGTSTSFGFVKNMITDTYVSSAENGMKFGIPPENKNAGAFISKEDKWKEWELYAQRDERMMCLQTPWFNCMITGLKRDIKEAGCNFTIEATSLFDIVLNKIELRREFATLKGIPYNLLNIINDPYKIWMENKLGVNSIDKYWDFKKNTFKPDADTSFDQKFRDASEEFFKTFYDPRFAVPNEEELKKDEPTKYGAEAPRNIWVLAQGTNNNEPFKDEVEYEFLDSPPSSPWIKPKGGLGTILNELLIKIPPKKFKREVKGMDQTYGVLSPITDNEERDFVKTGKYNLGANYQEEPNEYINYKFKIVPTPADDGKGGATYNRLIFYYGDRTDPKNREKFRVYQPRSHKSIVTSLSIDQDPLYQLLSVDIRSNDNEKRRRVSEFINQKMTSIVFPQASTITNEIPGMGMGGRSNVLTLKNIDQLNDVSQENRRDISIAILKKVDEFLANSRNEEERTRALEVAEYVSGNTKMDFPEISFGVSQLNGNVANKEALKSLTNNSSNRAIINIIGDPFWLFDEKVSAGLYAIKLDVMRPSLATDGTLTQEKDAFLSGEYLVTGIKHSLNISNGFDTTLTLQRVPIMDDKK